MKKIIVIVLFVITCGTVITCCFIDGPYYGIAITNNKVDSLYFYCASNSCCGGVSPDTTLSFERSYVRKVWPKWKFYVEYSEPVEVVILGLPSKMLSMYFFSKDTVDKYTWDEVRQGYKILQRYDLSIQDLQQLDYEVPYPPTEVMSHMKMWPPYGQQ